MEGFADYKLAYERLDNLSDNLSDNRDKPSENITIEMFLKTNHIFEVLKKDENMNRKTSLIYMATLINEPQQQSTTYKHTYVGQNKLIEELEKKQSSSSSRIIIKHITTVQAKNIINAIVGTTNPVSFDLTFHKMKFSAFVAFLNKNEKQLDTLMISKLYFDNLSKTEAESFIQVLREKSFHFSLEFKELTYDQAVHVLKNADLQQENVELKAESLRNFYPPNAAPTLELDEFAAKGIEYTLKINEKLFIPYRSICFLATLCAVQATVGMSLIGTGACPALGVMLVGEVFSDSFEMCKKYSTRQQLVFNDYLYQKAISMFLSASTIGFDKITRFGKSLTLTKTLALEAKGASLAQATLVSSETTIVQSVTRTSASRSLALKQFGAKTTKAAFEGVNLGTQYLSTVALDRLRPQIFEHIHDLVRQFFCKTVLSNLLVNICENDEKDLNKPVSKIVDDILSKPSNVLTTSIVSDVVSFISWSTNQYQLNLLTIGVKAIPTLSNMISLTKMIENVCEKLATKLSYAGTIVLNDNLSVTSNEQDGANRTIQMLRNLFSLEDKHRVKESEAMGDEFAALDRFSKIIKCVSDKITDHIVSEVKINLVKPLSTHSVNSILDAFSSRLEDHGVKIDKLKNSYSHNSCQAKYDELTKKSSLSDKEQKFVNWFANNKGTICAQISGNVKEISIAYQQLEPDEPTNSSRKSTKEKCEYADKVIANKPAGVVEMAILTHMNGVNLKVVDVKKYPRTQDAENVQVNENVIYIESMNGNQARHAMDQAVSCCYMNQNGEFVMVQTDTANDCLYGAMSLILSEKGVSKSIQTLRAETSGHINHNPNFKQIIYAEQWIKGRNNHVSTDQ